MIRFLSILALILSTTVGASDYVNILIYHHVATGTPPSTSVTLEQFTTHMDQLEADGFVVVDLSWAIEQIQQGNPISENSVAITFDDGFADIYHNAYPLLKSRNIPFTLFVATDAIDHKKRGMMTWDMLREMKANGVTIANHTLDHDYLVRKDSLDGKWLDDTWTNILNAQARIETELGESPKWLAYPYGEYNNALKDRLKENKWIAFGQQSGGVAIFSDFQALPRFPAAGIYANWSNLRVKMRSHPLPVDYESLVDPIIAINPPVLSATLNTELLRKGELSCFIEGSRKQPEWLDKKSFSVQSDKPLPLGRSRYNCTVPDNSGFYYWFSHQWLNVGK